MSNMVIIHNLINPETGKTFRQENMELDHNIPIGTLVEVKWDSWFGEGACWRVHARLWVVGHTRDCDGTPLYTISRWHDPNFALSPLARGDAHGGFSESSLIPLTITPQIKEGQGFPGWEDLDAT